MELLEIVRYNIKKILLGLVVIIGLAVIFVFLVAQIKSPTIKVDGKNFSLYIAKTDKDKQIGLSKYKDISETRGMLFIFDKPDYYPFWMKGMRFPIDIIYIKDDKVVTVLKNLKAESSDSIIYYPTSPANKVLEVKAGVAVKNGIEPGDVVELKNL